MEENDTAILWLLPTPRVLTNLEAWIRRRLRLYLWRQWQNGPNRFNELRRRGVPKFNAAVAAGSPTGFWRMSGHPAVQQALRNHFFDSLGVPLSRSTISSPTARTLTSPAMPRASARYRARWRALPNSRERCQRHVPSV